MIKHIVLIKALSSFREEDLALIFNDLASLKKRLTGMRSASFGRSESPEGRERGYTHGLVIEFDDMAALNDYAQDAEHQAIGIRLIAATVGGLDGVLFVDLVV